MGHGMPPAPSQIMPKINRYEDLSAWQLAMDLADLVDAMVSKGPAASDRSFVDQILRSSAKAPAQIAEGFLRYTPADSANYYRMARASIGETQTHLERGRRRKYFDERDVVAARAVSEAALKTTTGLLKSRLEVMKKLKTKAR
jgi:four helix bundle protein